MGADELGRSEVAVEGEERRAASSASTETGSPQERPGGRQPDASGVGDQQTRDPDSNDREQQDTEEQTRDEYADDVRSQGWGEAPDDHPDQDESASPVDEPREDPAEGELAEPLTRDEYADSMRAGGDPLAADPGQPDLEVSGDDTPSDAPEADGTSSETGAAEPPDDPRAAEDAPAEHQDDPDSDAEAGTTLAGQPADDISPPDQEADLEHEASVDSGDITAAPHGRDQQVSADQQLFNPEAADNYAGDDEAGQTRDLQMASESDAGTDTAIRHQAVPERGQAGSAGASSEPDRQPGHPDDQPADTDAQDAQADPAREPGSVSADQPPSQEDRDRWQAEYQEYLRDAKNDKDAAGGWDQGANVVGDKPDRSPGDMSDLPPTGEQLLNMEEDRLSRFEALRRESEKEEVLDGLHSDLEHGADAIQKWLGQRPPPGHAEQPVPASPQRSPEGHHAEVSAGSVATVGLVLAVMGIEAGRLVHRKLETLRGDDHGGN